ncbi:NAD-dependent epimerase/dehydratase family protein [Pseudomonas sp. CCM 7891]|uniref:NAD-dependent epimerase/dehydratase family protein n=1 Tax=Pseudomonas karstica TaxID=1055468 RepID=A0A7X2UX58_9PSED|nr:NAD-dependent epimerase/dehydratase family protein [Pseudomonas karstica]MTD18103.1 NAD-dependent epimerase/dehydratase family protein [Pseudomonas karstica]
MNRPLVGLVGAGGAVGSAALAQLLQHDLRVRGGQRQAQVWPDGVDGRVLDLFDAQALADFCAGCQVVLNCAGPSWRVGDRVAQAAHGAGAAYVDAFGNAALLSALQGARQPSIIGAGVFPGLTALLPRWLASRSFDRVSSLQINAGGREHCSNAGGADVLLSALGGFGTPNAHWVDGRVQTLAIEQQMQHLPGFPEAVFRSAYLTDELRRLASTLGVPQASFHNVFDHPQIPALIATLCQRLSQDPSALPHAVAQLVQAADLQLLGRRAYYRLSVELTGWGDGQAQRQRAVLSSQDSYGLSATIAVCATLQLLHDQSWRGAHWAGDCLPPATVIDAVQASTACQALSIVNLAVESVVSEEEGVL